ncbi:FMN-dependent NADH-azoreductase [Paraburkholderia ginsengiterrae]|uniref:FMN dependent NADH:quinone oxidoreductase n=1 Tax=Paraburkholderia ginsengiterrae TaxID=1462993 RepID=A0A1A9N3R6_9BURK|nr:NAD(P)H-dependent oxidoreductase [Paraburkholderia ginsengiterrae]OAJ57277.1 FMN-dependent NADH-azoreductase [Paraburkholderia ginsengiterrae]OAJ60943.1 FMN-dependent NADH-azoreductase [Paraburkholderia ginsengiterrae]
MKLLHIDSSISGAQSVSRTLTAEIVKCQKALHPGIEVVYRDLAADPALHLSHAHVDAWTGGTVEGAALSCDLETGEEYLAELFVADIIVIGAPMYNFSVPSQLKAWIDRIVVEGQTFEYSESGELQTFLPSAKKVIIASTRGNVYQPGTPTAAHEHHESYLLTVFSFLGLHDVTVVRAEGLAFGPDTRDAAISKARFAIATIAV